MPLHFDYDDDGEVNNLANSSTPSVEVAAMQKRLHKQLVEQFSYPEAWLATRRKNFVKGELKFDQHMGFEPY